MARSVCIFLFLGMLTCGAAQSNPGEGAGKLAGEECTLPAGGVGVCRRISGCPEAKEALRKGEAVVVCSYEELRPVVCCANISAATRMCAKYSEAVFRYEKIPTIIPQTAKIDQCAMRGAPFNRRKRVVGGEKARVNEFPHMALLNYGNDEKAPKWLGAGSLISERYVLTVAHNIITTIGSPKMVRLGELNLNTTEDGSRHEDFKVAEAIPHPDYKKDAVYNDIGLLRLDRDVVFTASIRPACLHARPEIGDDEAIATGWGFTDWAIPDLSDDLLKVKLPIQKTEVCRETFKTQLTTNRLRNGIMEESMVCAGALEGGKDTCKGDNGGPLQVALKTPYCMYSIVGITSFGKSVCGAKNSPGIYTRVSFFTPWIEKTVWPELQ